MWGWLRDRWRRVLGAILIFGEPVFVLLQFSWKHIRRLLEYGEHAEFVDHWIVPVVPKISGMIDALPILSLPVILASIVLGFALLWWDARRHRHLQPPKGKTPDDKRPWKNTLEDLFAKAFPDLLSLDRRFTATLTNKEGGDAKSIEVRFRLHQDFRSSTDLISFFVPQFSDARMSAETLQYLAALRDALLKQREEARSQIGTGSASPGTAYVSSSDLKFSGRVFLYTLNALTLPQLAELVIWYKQAGIDLEIRGHDFWWFHKDD